MKKIQTIIILSIMCVLEMSCSDRVENHVDVIKHGNIISIPVKDKVIQYSLIKGPSELWHFNENDNLDYIIYHCDYIIQHDNKDTSKSIHTWCNYHAGKWYSKWPYVFEFIPEKHLIKVYKLEEVYNWEVK